MTKLEELKAYRDAAFAAHIVFRTENYADYEASCAASYADYHAACVVDYTDYEAARDAYQAELKKTNKEQTND